jgi:hypothetical protein
MKKAIPELRSIFHWRIVRKESNSAEGATHAPLQVRRPELKESVLLAAAVSLPLSRRRHSRSASSQLSVVRRTTME